jgi:hypothetical protein
MLENKYCIISVPLTNKHYVVRTSFEVTDLECILNINGMKANASLVAIADSYNEAVVIYNNLKE